MKLLIAFLSSALLLNACVYTKKRETHLASAPEKTVEGWQTSKQGPIELKSFIYKPAKLPLERFFSNLVDGEFNQAFTDLDITYDSKNFQNEAMEKLLDEGYIPTYVQITNTGSEAVPVAAEKLVIEQTNIRSQAIASGDVPFIFKDFNTKALGANVYNSLVITSTFVVVIAAMLVTCKSGCNGVSSIGGNSRGSRRSAFNDLDKTVELKFEDFLFPTKNLQPSESAEGLVFYRIEDSSKYDWDLFRTQLQNP